MKAMINKLSYVAAVLSHLVGIGFLKNNAFMRFYLTIFPLCAIIVLLFFLIVDNTEKIREGDLVVFFYFLVSIFYMIFVFIDKAYLIPCICLLASSSFSLLARKTDKYWASKKDVSVIDKEDGV